MTSAKEKENLANVLELCNFYDQICSGRQPKFPGAASAEERLLHVARHASSCPLRPKLN